MSSTPARPFEIELPLEIGTYDVDFAGVVSNIVYVRWLEDLRNALLKKFFPLERLLERGSLPVVAQTRVNYKEPLRLFDQPIGRMWAQDMGDRYFMLEAEFTLGGKVVATAEQVAVFVNRSDWQPTPIPEELAQLYRELRAPKES
ncbi:MAG: acyl-CoA thioesterase [Candidatus Marinimicrobia bacterium]|nr:acyl-CoA thioesterase [Candidatus Neomarinimicrobiota bacterium]